MFRISFQKVVNKFSANTLSLTIDSHTNSEQVNRVNSFLSESAVLGVADREDGISHDTLSILLPGHQDFVVNTTPKLLHDEFGV